MKNGLVINRLCAVSPTASSESMEGIGINCLALAVDVSDGWYIYTPFTYESIISSSDTASGISTVVLPDAVDEDVLKIVLSCIKLGGYHIVGEVVMEDITYFLQSIESRLLQGHFIDTHNNRGILLGVIEQDFSELAIVFENSVIRLVHA